MKYCIILGDGMAGEPVLKKNNQTTLMAAHKPTIDTIARLGRTGFFHTVPKGMAPGSAVANLGVLGYDAQKYFKGRGVLEAASIGVNLESDDLALRCNLITIEKGKIKNHSAGHISTEEASELINTLNESFATDEVRFYCGTSYRHLTVVRKGSEDLICTPPHDVPGSLIKDHFIVASNPAGQATADLLNGLIKQSIPLLENHPVNMKRRQQGKDPANCVWFWAQGTKPSMPTYQELFGLKGAVISAVDLIKGIGVYAGMDVISVQGATGLYDTNFEGKAQAAIDALKTHDFVFVHVEAADEAGHDGDFDLKVKCIESLDQRLVKLIYNHIQTMDEPVTLAILPDHPTPIEKRTHTSDPVPFIILRPDLEPDCVEKYDEISCKNGGYETISRDGFIKRVLTP